MVQPTAGGPGGGDDGEGALSAYPIGERLAGPVAVWEHATDTLLNIVNLADYPVWNQFYYEEEHPPPEATSCLVDLGWITRFEGYAYWVDPRVRSWSNLYVYRSHLPLGSCYEQWDEHWDELVQVPQDQPERREVLIERWLTRLPEEATLAVL